MTDLPDINVWLGLSDPNHPMHESATAYWHDEASPSLAFCRTTALGLPRLLCRQTYAGGVSFSSDEAWRIYLDWRASRGVSLLADPAGVEERLQAFVDSGIVLPRLWTDAYLAAFAISAGLRLVTFDKDFERFPGLVLLRL